MADREAQAELKIVDPEINRIVAKNTDAVRSQLAAKGSSTEGGGGACLLVLAIFVGIPLFFVWIGVVLLSPNYEANEQARRKNAAALMEVEAKLLNPFPATYRLELRRGGNLRIYVPLKEWEDIPFPDRKAIVISVGSPWCGHVEKTYLPAVSIRDVRTGRELASYSCVFERVGGF